VIEVEIGVPAFEKKKTFNTAVEMPQVSQNYQGHARQDTGT
jgi:hypothetical protein